MHDLAIIGAGWAGFNAAQTAKSLGLKVALIERSRVGGTCLNLGCIPTKALLQSAKILSYARKAQNFGITLCAIPTPDFEKIQERKDKIIQQLGQGMQMMLKGVDLINGQASIISPTQIKTESQAVETKAILIATGSRPAELPFLKFDNKKIISSNEILSLKSIPASLLIVGGGVIGCEFATLYSTLGTKVTVIEKLPQLLPGLDAEISRKILNSFKKKGITVSFNADVMAADLNSFDLVLVCVGRKPNLEGLGLEDLGVKLENGKIRVDEYLKTNIDNIYAAGDVTGKTMLAHFAAYQGSIAAGNIASPQGRKKADNSVISNCIFTDPEIACVGIGEEEAKAKNIDYTVHRMDFLASGMARILDETEGFVKLLSDKKSGAFLGGSIIGPKATELIAVLGLALSNGLGISCIEKTIFAHPTLSEIIPEALKQSHGA